MASPSSASPRQTLSTDLMACLGQEDMTDLHLLGTDGVKVPGFRTVLACRSDVFRKMLVGKFEESTSEVVKLDYDSETLKAVVEFCITDNVMQFDGRFDESAARGIVQLVACAHFLNVPLLQDKARTLAAILLEVHKPLACAIYDEAALFGEPTEPVKLDALTIIRKYPEDSFLSKAGVLALRPESLGDLISDDGMACEEVTLFRALNQWATAENAENSFDLSPKAERRRIAKKLVTHICLSSMRPTDLVGSVRKSCLVDEKAISAALESQAILAEKEANVSFSKRRKARPSVTVSGAGTSVVNGFYEEDGIFNSFPKYTKKCIWEGENRTLCIYRYNAEDWYIALVDKSGLIGAYGNDIYHANKQDSVPRDGWIPQRLGSNPCPDCHESP